MDKIENGSFFAVYDGHGEYGHLCSRYVRDKARLFEKLFCSLFLSSLVLLDILPEALCLGNHRHLNHSVVRSATLIGPSTKWSVIFLVIF